jgi:hypothetical protein
VDKLHENSIAAARKSDRKDGRRMRRVGADLFIVASLQFECIVFLEALPCRVPVDPQSAVTLRRFT